MHERTQCARAQVVARMDQANARLTAYAEDDPPPEVEARVVREVERLMAVGLARGLSSRALCRWAGIDPEFLAQVVAARRGEPVVIAACAATGAGAATTAASSSRTTPTGPPCCAPWRRRAPSTCG